MWNSARVSAVEGRRVQLSTIEAVRRHGHITREYTLTYRDALQDNERLIDGTFWSAPLTTPRTPDGADTEVSIEREVHDEASVDIGDLMRFNVAGHVLSARVTSIREVTWDQTQNGGFIFVLRPGPAKNSSTGISRFPDGEAMTSLAPSTMSAGDESAAGL